ncbi:MAG: tol-pal system protein YbgF [Acidobacteriota bacterium]|nr:MAG: tol-pal system protein YbgF [Acidobacteriota bacterium]
MRQLFTLLTLCFTVLILPLSAGTKEEIIRLQSDILQLQDQIRVLQKNVDEKNGMIISLLEQLNDQAAEGNVGFQELVTATNAAKAQSSSLDRTVQSVQEELRVLSAKLDETNTRVAAVHRKLEENQVQIQSLRTVEQSVGDDIEPDRIYSATFNDYLMGNYALAVNGFQDFLANFPDSEYGDNAAYYLGDCYFKQGRLDLAIQAFEQVINLYPKGDKTAVAYYKKAQALQELQRLEQAIETLKALKQLFPNAPEAQLANDDLIKLGVE